MNFNGTPNERRRACSPDTFAAICAEERLSALIMTAATPAAVPEAHAEALSLKQDSPCFFQQKVDKMGASVALKNIDEFTTEKGTDAAQQRVADGGDVEPPSPVMSRLKRSDSGRFF